MSTPELFTRVQAALASIPHSGDCEPYPAACSCDREARIAEAVAQAIQAASYGSIGKATRERVVEALAALEEVRP